MLVHRPMLFLDLTVLIPLDTSFKSRGYLLRVIIICSPMSVGPNIAMKAPFCSDKYS
jgi:hypothetical protein